MKKMTWLLGVVMSIFIFSSCGSTAHVQKDNTYNFRNVKTYAWVEGTQKDKNGISAPRKTNDMTGRKIRESIDRNLQQNGWQLSNRNPDVLLVYDVDVQKENRNVSDPVYSQSTTRWFYNPYARRYVPIYYPSQFLGYDNRTETIKAGTLTLTMMDADTDKTIWQGWTTSEVNGRTLSDRQIDNNVKAIIKKLEKAS
jgi:hypothetical protein